MSKPMFTANYRRGPGDVRLLSDTGTHISTLDIPLLQVPEVIQALLRAYTVEAIGEQLAREAR